MNKFILFSILFFTGLLTAQVSENREVADFSKLKVSSGIEVFYSVSDVKSVKVEADNLDKMQYIKTEVIGGTLKLYIDTDKKTKSKKGKKSERLKKVNNNRWINGIAFDVLKITVSGPNLSEIKASSSAFLKMENVNKSDNLDVAVSSSGSIKGSFECNSIDIDVSSSGEFLANVVAKTAEIESSSSSMVVLNGKAIEVNVKASSSGDCDLKDFEVEKATVLASSSASVAVYASKSIEAKASSSASVSFYGNPTNVSKEISSSGSVSKKKKG